MGCGLRGGAWFEGRGRGCPAGLMLVYMIVAGDILAGGGEGYPGLLCDLLGDKASSWCSDRPLVILAATLLAFAPLCSFKYYTPPPLL